MNENRNYLTDEEIVAKIDSLQQFGYSRAFCALVYLHYITAGRVTDILSLSGRNFSAGYVCTLNQSKFSNKIIVYVPLYHDIIDVWRSSSARIGGTYSRQSIYRIYKKIGLTLQRGNGRNNSVTHNFRVRRAQDVYDNSGELEDVTAVLGHKSKRTAKYYVQNKTSAQNVQRGVFISPTNTNDVIVSNRLGVIRARK